MRVQSIVVVIGVDINHRRSRGKLSSVCRFRADITWLATSHTYAWSARHCRPGQADLLPAQEGVSWGLSLPQTSLKEGQIIPVFIWIDNSTDKNQSHYYCCNYSFLKHIRIFDSTGQRLISSDEANILKSRTKGGDVIESCSCSSYTSVGPRSQSVVDYGNLALAFTLKPGRYFLTVKYPGVLTAEIQNEKLPAETAGINFTIQAK